jgi:hypothetical protein
MIVLKALTPNSPLSLLLKEANDNGEFIVVCLHSSLYMLPLSFFEFSVVLCGAFVVDTVKVQSNNLPILRFR